MKNGDIKRRWRHVDADGQVLGRMAAQIATVLMGKHRPEYTPHVDTGDYVVVTNAERIVVTGRKADQRTLMRYSVTQVDSRLAHSVRNLRSSPREPSRRPSAECFPRLAWDEP